MSSDQLSMFGETEQQGSPTSFSLSKTINGKQQQVCDHWLIPVFVGKWMFGPQVQAEKILKLENTVRKNGEFSYRIHRRGQEVIHSGEYLELNLPNKLTFSWKESNQPDSACQISVQFAEQAEKTKLKMTVRIPAELSSNKDKIKKVWSARCKALADKFK